MNKILNIIFRFQFQIVLVFIFSVSILRTLEKDVLNPECPQGLVKMDAIEYYGYLPAFFIYKDPGFGFLNHPLPKENISNFWVKPHKSGKYTTRMTLGFAFLASPGFIVGHIAAGISEYPRDGFSKPYMFFTWLWILFCVLISLIWIKNLLVHYELPDPAISLTVLTLVLGTNLFNYITFETFMTHCINFILCTGVLYGSVFWYKTGKLKFSILAAFSFGMISIIRPTDAILLLIPVFIGIQSLSDFKERAKFWIRNKYTFSVFFIIPICILIMQIMYWKWATGNYFYYGYEGERFFFSHWLLPEYLFSFRKGWLLYTPVLTFAIAGLFMKFFKNSGYSIWILVIIFISAWIHSCWWCWWFGGSFGARSMIDFYPLLALPLAVFFNYFLKKGIILKSVFAVVISFLIILNYKQVQQYQSGIIHWDSMTAKAYRAVFLKSGTPPGFEKMLSPTDAEAAKKGKIFR